MGKVRIRSEKKGGDRTQLANAIRAYRDKKYTSIRAAAESYGVPYSTFYGRLNGGRQNRLVAHEKDQIIAPAEEKAIVNWITRLDNRRFPPRVDMVVYQAKKILQARGGDLKLGSHWTSQFLNRHPQLASKFSSQVKKQ